ncbi:DNA-3-methyladenine glycosylase 1 [Hartmannibacter diazotrophicus]|uniref:DNA-3-methyladenine glycosylase 1 n=1 Tax=Hartmannibacter diazotrophicus TaxID=1482074 RepID=A0A2C9D525_9HYPH|nr:DNA-3-methyladenine glycosylase I [Hartmannibacter diazotrophicus]SON54605.1 DNA-3-methyladenine glycosylase 1 [Hartmannibacter diazotrophicus]
MEDARGDGLDVGADGIARCWWQGGLDDYRRYHDEEWGRPVADNRLMFEKLCLEGFQSGLSWLTILRKRENFRAAFAGFDIDKVAEYGDADVERLLGDAGIVRHKGKILAVINNAKRARAMRDRGLILSALVWSHEPDPESRPKVCDKAALMTLGKTKESTALSKLLRKDGWSFVGPTTVYAFMQSMGVVNDHVEGCHCRAHVEAARAAFVRPAW